MNNDSSKPIGIFDSGLGGLTVLKELQKNLPNESYIYFGDLAHVPYGNKSPTLITNYSNKISKYLIENDVKLIIIACNSASSIALKYLRDQYDIPFIGVIEPSVKYGIKKTITKHVAIIGTEATIRSKAYSKCISKYDKTISTYEFPCPLLVPLIEEGWDEHPITNSIIEEYLLPIKNNSKIDTLILGCTHYPILHQNMNNFFENKMNIISCGPSISQSIIQYLSVKNLLNTNTDNYTKFIVSDISDKFHSIASIFLDNKEIKIIEANPFNE